MSEIFFIGDTHFGHKGIIEFSSTKVFRPFDTIEEHNEELVRRWNATVGKNDKVYHLGDFCFGKKNIEIASRLNGRKHLIMGNHDMYQAEEYLKYFYRVSGAFQFKSMILTHIPVYPRELNRFTMNIHGHLHTEKIDDYRYVCVSAEQINLTPVPVEYIYDIWAKNN